MSPAMSTLAPPPINPSVPLVFEHGGHHYRFKHNTLYADGVAIASGADREPGERLAATAYGHVLEVGIGLGFTHRALHANPAVTRITPLDRHAPILAHFAPCCAGIVAAWPCPNLDLSAFDYILMDI